MYETAPDLFCRTHESNAGFEVIEELAVTGDGVVEDQLTRLSSLMAKKDHPEILSRVCFKREEGGKVLNFITNDMEHTAIEIADLYKRRWQIEWFFKWIKQHLKITRFIGTSKSVVHIRIMIAYLLLGMARKLMPIKKSLQQLASPVIT